MERLQCVCVGGGSQTVPQQVVQCWGGGCWWRWQLGPFSRLGSRFSLEVNLKDKGLLG